MKPRLILFLNLMGCLASLAVLLIFPYSTAVLWIGSIGLGFSLASIFPSTITLANQQLNLSGRITGIFIVGSSAGAMLLPWAIGQLFEARGPQVVTLLLLAATGLAVLIFAAMLRFSIITNVDGRSERSCE
jgi:FHS family Na+ dependent glucose MFS transporter 1